MAPDLCQPGLLLRALIAVHLALALGLAFGAESFSAWWWAFAQGAAQAWPAVLLWAGTVCPAFRAIRVRWGRVPSVFEGVAAAWAGVCALLALWAWSALVPTLPGSSAASAMRPWAQALAGVAASALLLAWARARSHRAQPAAEAARLMELQARIRPHFLFNSLNTALALVRVEPARAEAVLEDLAELFRAALDAGGAGAVSTLGAEIELARRYLAIEQMRFGSRMQVKWDLQPEAARASLPVLLLQPLLENAVRHGVEPAAEGGRILVRTRLRLGQAWVLVSNTLPGAAAQPPGAGHGIALDNVRERLALMHDLGAHFEAGARDGEYRVEFAVPA